MIIARFKCLVCNREIEPLTKQIKGNDLIFTCHLCGNNELSKFAIRFEEAKAVMGLELPNSCKYN